MVKDTRPGSADDAAAYSPEGEELADRGAKVLILAHFGRPKGQKNPEFSLSKITRPLSQVLGREVQFIPDCA
ncbi:MAG: phosphoglycerate kinase, partial [Candidatus Nanopelagicales bacterium]